MNCHAKKSCISFLADLWASVYWCVSKRNTWTEHGLFPYFNLKMVPHISLRDFEGETQSSFCSMSSSLHGLDGFLSSHCTVCSRGLSRKSSLAFLATNKAESHFLCSLAIWTLTFMKCFLFIPNFKTVLIKLVIKVANKKVIHQS